MFNGALSQLTSFVVFASTFAAILILPGYLISSLIFNGNKLNIYERIPISFSFSICYVSTLGLLLYMFNSSVSTLIVLLLVSVPLLIVTNIVLRRRRGRTLFARKSNAAQSTSGSEDRGYRVSFALFALMFIAFLLMIYRGAMFSWEVDSMDHVGTVRDIVEKRQLFPTNAFYAGEDGLGPDPRKGLYHAALAMISIITRIEPYQIWIWLPALTLPILLCSYFAFMNELFKSKYIALLSAILFLLCFEGTNRTLLGAAGYPSRVATQVYMTALLLMFKYLRRENMRYFFGGAFLGYAIATIHIYYFFQFCLAWSAYFIFACLFRRSDKRMIANIVKLGVATVLVSIPYLIIKYTTSYSVNNPNHAAIRHMLYFSDSIFVVSPSWPLRVVGPMGIFAFILTPFLYKYAKKHNGILFLFANMIITPLIIFNPPVVSTLGKLITNGLVRRIIRLAPYIAVVGLFSYEMISALVEKKRWRVRAKGFLFFALLIFFLIPYISQFYDDYKPASKIYERNHSAFQWFNALKFLEENITTPSVVLSDPRTSYSIPAFTKHYVVAVPVGHASPKDSENVARIRDAMKVLNPYIDIKNTTSILNKYNVRYVVINQTFKSRVDGHGWALNPNSYSEMRQKFESHPSVFRNVYDEERLHIYEYDRRADTSELEIDEVIDAPFILTAKPNLPNVVNAVYSKQFLLLGAVTDKNTVGKGDILRMKCYWKNLKDSVPSKYYRVCVRFDTDYDKNTFYRPYWSKIYRSVRQRMTGERYRFRADHNPVNGFYPPNNWRLGEVVLDEFEVTIPADVSAGSYDVKIKLVEMTVGANFHFSDLLQDNDNYDGAKVGSIVIRP